MPFTVPSTLDKHMRKCEKNPQSIYNQLTTNGMKSANSIQQQQMKNLKLNMLDLKNDKLTPVQTANIGGMRGHLQQSSRNESNDSNDDIMGNNDENDDNDDIQNSSNYPDEDIDDENDDDDDDESKSARDDEEEGEEEEDEEEDYKLSIHQSDDNDIEAGELCINTNSNVMIKHELS